MSGDLMTGTYCHRCKRMTGIRGHGPRCPVPDRTEGEEVCNDE